MLYHVPFARLPAGSMFIVPDAPDTFNPPELRQTSNSGDSCLSISSPAVEISSRLTQVEYVQYPDVGMSWCDVVTLPPPKSHALPIIPVAPFVIVPLPVASPLLPKLSVLPTDVAMFVNVVLVCSKL